LTKSSIFRLYTVELFELQQLTIETICFHPRVALQVVFVTWIRCVHKDTAVNNKSIATNSLKQIPPLLDKNISQKILQKMVETNQKRGMVTWQ
jgi:hypothetical protein